MRLAKLILIIVIFLLLAASLYFGIKTILKNKKKKNILRNIDRLTTEKNLIISSTLITELARAEKLVNNKKTEKEVNEWATRFAEIEQKDLPSLTDELVDIETSLMDKNYNESIDKLEHCEKEILRVKAKSIKLLGEIKELTESEDRNREAITKLKSIYREVVFKYNKNKNDYHDVSSSITTSDTPIDIPERNHSWFNSAVEGVISFFEEYWPFILGGLAVILLILGGIWLFKPKVETVTVDNVYWERSIEVERYQTVDESDWYLPEGARLHETRSEIYTYKQVLDHYEHKSRQVSKQRLDHYETKVVGHRDLGNGYFEEITEQVPVYETYYETEYYDEPVYRSDPIFKTKYYYEIDKWLHDRNLITSGCDKNPKWADTSKLKSNERPATKKEDYTITYTNKKGKQKTVSLPYSQWNDLMVGDEVTIKVTIFGDAEIV